MHGCYGRARGRGYGDGGGGYGEGSGGSVYGGGGGGRYSASRADPRLGAPAALTLNPKITPAEVQREMERISVASRGERYGSAGEPVDLSINFYPTALSVLPEVIPHFDLVFEVLEEQPVGGYRRVRDVSGRGGRARSRKTKDDSGFPLESLPS